MALPKPQRGDTNWDASLNAKLDDLDMTLPASANAVAASATYVAGKTFTVTTPTAPRNGDVWLSSAAADLTISPAASGRQVAIAPSQAWDNAAVQEPRVWWDGTQYNAVFSGGWGTPAVGHATAASPLGPWTKNAANPIIGQGNGGQSGQSWRPFVLVDGANLYVYYADSGGNIRVKAGTVAGGVASLGSPSTALAVTASATGHANCSVIKDGSVYRIMFDSTPAGSTIYQIGTATASTPVGPFTIVQYPVTGLIQGAAGAMVGGPNITKENGGYTLLYHAAISGLLPTDIYRATSADALTWVAEPDPLVSRLLNVEYDQVADPFLLTTPSGARYLFWDATNNPAAHASIMAARVSPRVRQYLDGGYVDLTARRTAPKWVALSMSNAGADFTPGGYTSAIPGMTLTYTPARTELCTFTLRALVKSSVAGGLGINLLITPSPSVGRATPSTQRDDITLNQWTPLSITVSVVLAGGVTYTIDSMVYNNGYNGTTVFKDPTQTGLEMVAVPV